ncbi:YciI family protein [Demequina sp.]|uniref:YciI family protein n=1 Tax=Demequina sp. TaxID=2050685 RepID=UPI0025D55866|nr:YciI family protein [Demequina sp.]
MSHFYLSMYYEQESGHTPGDLPQIMSEIDAFNDELRDDGAWVTAAAFEPAPRAHVVTTDPEGSETTDGPYLRTEEQSGGYWVIEARTMGDAIVWAQKASHILRLPIEVRKLAA